MELTKATRTHAYMGKRWPTTTTQPLRNGQKKGTLNGADSPLYQYSGADSHGAFGGRQNSTVLVHAGDESWDR